MAAPAGPPPPAEEDDERSVTRSPMRLDIDDAPVGKPRSRGIIAAIKDFFAGEPADEPAPRPESAPAPKREIAMPRPPAKNLRGRVTLHRAGLLVIEIVADGVSLAWAPAAEALVTLITQHAFTAKLDAGRTTRAGTVHAGATARLALELPAGAPLDAVLSITIELGGEIVTIEV
jgi:hypothetical protein